MLKVVINWMVKKLRWFIIPLAINPVLPLLILLPKICQIHIILSTPRTFQPPLATLPTSLPPASPSSSTSRPSLIPTGRPSPIPHIHLSTTSTCGQIQ
ncbi:hypothetical protein O181_036861 [Austropuccinia psidii MF-1]|uniref:Uncharacterized protein n=1 Tax=Austropuccinia psidii MF-1 TaxID=1389203 RepID=A0A9Q3D565_9BASI|nr:hypothetical protein [Austropuccinia psidii MF-1]